MYPTAQIDLSIGYAGLAGLLQGMCRGACCWMCHQVQSKDLLLENHRAVELRQYAKDHRHDDKTPRTLGAAIAPPQHQHALA